jgi:peptide/nickel transport system substrate-binding protein
MGNLFDPTVGVQRLYWSKNFKAGLPFSNGSHYNNPEVDRLLEAASQAVDETERRSLFDQFQRVIVQDIPEINLTSPDQIFVATKSVRNHSSTSENVSSSFSDVWLAPH